MHLAPVALYFHGDSSATTHGAAEALDCCELFAEILTNALTGGDKSAVLRSRVARPTPPRLADLATGGYLGKPVSQIVGSGYCVESLEARRRTSTPPQSSQSFNNRPT